MTFDPRARVVGEEMSKDVVWLQPDDSILNALSMMERERVTALLVVDERERCVGILSATDLIAATRQIIEQLSLLGQLDDREQRDKILDRLTSNGILQRTVADLMTKPVLEANHHLPIVEAGESMLRRRIHHLPVVDDERRLLGIVSTLDLVAAFVKSARTADGTSAPAE